MRHRWCDVNEESAAEYEDPDHADFVGGIGDVDLWVNSKFSVLICQYEDDDEYVSYYPASAVLDHAKGVLTYENTPNLAGRAVSDPINVDKRLLWHGTEASIIGHRPKEIAAYLAIFAPYIFTEDERETALGFDLATQGELK